MAESIYLLCALTSLACAALLVRHYRRGRTKLLLWSSVAFVGLALNNALLFIDVVIATQTDLSLLRTGTAVVAMVVLVFGLVWESR